MSHNEDLRVRRTKRLLRDTFIELVASEGYQGMTVQALARRAMVNRSTFYRHYSSVDDLAHHVYDHVNSEYTSTVAAHQPLDQFATWRLLFDHVESYADFYRRLLSELPAFRDFMIDTLEQQMRVELHRLGLDEAHALLPVPLVIRYIASAQLGVIEWWLDEPNGITAIEMAGAILNLDLHGALESLGLPTPEPRSATRSP